MTRAAPTITIPDIAEAPELAVLAALVAVLDVAGDALLATHPELADHERPYWVETPAIVGVAANVLRRAAGLRRAIARYRQAVAPVTPPPDEPAPGWDTPRTRVPRR